MAITRLTTKDVEILVHTTAPSRGQDDARYRAIAQAYLDFQPTSRHKIEARLEPILALVGSHINPASQIQEEVQALCYSERESEASYRPDTQSDAVDLEMSVNSYDANNMGPEQSMNSSQLSFSSVLDNRDSPWFQHAVTHGGDDYQSFVAPSSVVADSQDTNDHHRSFKELDSPSQVLQLYLQYNMKIPSQPFLGREPQEENPLALRMNSSSNHSSPSRRVLRSYKRRGSPIPNPSIASKKTKPTTESAPITAPVTSSAPVEPAATIPKPALKNIGEVRSNIRQDAELPRWENTRRPNVTLSENSRASARPIAIVPNLWSQVVEIRPPPPETGNGPLSLDSLITRDLHQVADGMCLPDLYRPKEQARTLRAMERGHWLIKFEKWNEELRIRCWNCLGTLVAKGSLGWGVWCVRDIKSQSLRMYCWGAIVGHIYLVLHMASEGKIRGTEPYWIDADGKPIINMES